MKGTDKFLIAIVVGVVVLVAAALAVALVQRDRTPSYEPDDTPQGVAYDYLLALQLGEVERAHGYLSPTLPGYPADAKELARNTNELRWELSPERDASLAVESADVEGDLARVVIRETVFYRGGLFGSGGLFSPGQDTTTFTMTLAREDGAWKITDSERYWAWCWRESEGCR
jgi:hypothetical protein